MIDYDKLKLAHELAKDYGKLSDIYIGFTTYVYYKNREHLEDQLKIRMTVDSMDSSFNSLDELISKLKELNHIDKPKLKLKYKVGQEVWHLVDDEIESFIVEGLDNEGVIVDDGIYYRDEDYNWWLESQLYPSREALIEAQIAYWRNLLNE